VGATTAITWCDHTFNSWWGCSRVSPGCENCYAEAWSLRTGYSGKKLPLLWGVNEDRRFFGDKHWAEPLKWNRESLAAMNADENARPKRVFCASMSDVFEDRPFLVETRQRLMNLISDTPSLDWLILTKRPENIEALAPQSWGNALSFPSNVWLGTTVEDVKRAEQRIEHLARWPAPVRFVSYEPALEWVSFKRWESVLLWVIVGGESGPNARYFAETWAAQTLDELRGWRQGGGSVFIKQLGSVWAKREAETRRAGVRLHPHGADPREWPEHLRVQEFPS
jgi:protein gp37